MTELVVQVNEPTLLSDIRKAIRLIRGVGKVTTLRKTKTELQKAIDEVEAGKLYSASSVDDLMQQLNS